MPDRMYGWRFNPRFIVDVNDMKAQYPIKYIPPLKAILAHSPSVLVGLKCLTPKFLSVEISQL